MARVTQVKPVDEQGIRKNPIDIDLDHVLWMEECPEGTLLLMNRWDGREHPGALINSSIMVAESEREVL